MQKVADSEEKAYICRKNSKGIHYEEEISFDSSCHSSSVSWFLQ